MGDDRHTSTGSALEPHGTEAAAAENAPSPATMMPREHSSSLVGSNHRSSEDQEQAGFESGTTNTKVPTSSASASSASSEPALGNDAAKARDNPTGAPSADHDCSSVHVAVPADAQVAADPTSAAATLNAATDPGDASSSSTTRAAHEPSTAPLHLLAAAAAEPLHAAASETKCGPGGHCRSCSSLLHQCSTSKMSLESRLEQILQCNHSGGNNHRGRGDTQALNLSRHADVSSQEAAGRLRHSEPTSDIASCVSARHTMRFSTIREALSRKTADENQRHRDELKRVLRAMEDERRRRLGEETGIPLESVHLASKPNPSTAKASPEVYHATDPPHGGFEGNGGARDSFLNGTARAEQAPSRIEQRWLDETQKAMGRYLAQKALVEQSSRGSDSSSRPATVPEPVIPFALREELGVAEQATITEGGPLSRGAEKSRASERPAAVLPIKKRKEMKQSKDQGTKKKKAKKATPEQSPNPLTDLQRLEMETREFHKKTLPAGNNGARLRSFALQYNEWSVLAVAKWANQSTAAGGNNKNNNNNNSGAPLELPTSPTHFRKCNVCGKFGHFDVLCPRLSPDTSKSFQAEMDHLIAESDPITDVTELCEGYAIEQSNTPFDDADTARGPRKRRLPSQVCVTELDHLVIQAAPTADLLLEFA